MSAELRAEIDALKEAAREREESGFITMPLETLALRAEDRDPWTTLNRSVVTSGALPGAYIVAYSAPKESRGVSMWAFEAPAHQPQFVRSNSFLVFPERNTASIRGEIVFGDFIVEHERGVFNVSVPRKVVFSEAISFYTAELKRKTPRIVLGGHNRGEQDY